MRGLLKLVICEFLKLKRKKLFRAAFLTAFLMPLFYSLLLTSADLDDLVSVVTEENGFLILIPLLVVIASNLFFEEQDYDTLKNLLCVPIKKSSLASAKLVVLLLFSVCYQMAGYGIASFTGCYIRYCAGGMGTAAFSYICFRDFALGRCNALCPFGSLL